jgi:hypothetical protein
MIRNISGVALGLVTCQAVFSAGAMAAMLLWPEYAVHGRRYLDSRIFTFTSAMACLNLVFWVLGEIGAGWATAKTARDHRAVWILAGLMEAYAAAVHLLLHWSRFPWWYNLAVVIPVVPAALWGARFARADQDVGRRARLPKFPAVMG